jgi:hypothetical protein
MISWSKSEFVLDGRYCNQFYANSGFYTFCDYVEGVSSNSSNSSKLPGPAGVGLKTALAGYADWFKTEFLPGYCESYGMYPTSVQPVIFTF